MKKSIKISAILVALLLFISLPLFTNLARASQEDVTTEIKQEEVKDSATGDKALASGIAIGLSGLGGALAMGIAIGRAADGISRQPEADSKIRTSLMIGLVFIETVVIYALIVAILVIFVL